MCRHFCNISTDNIMLLLLNMQSQQYVLFLNDQQHDEVSF